MPDTKNFQLSVNKILGEEPHTSLENRATSGVCFVCTLIFITAIPLTLVLRAPQSFTLAYTLLACAYGTFYLMSRFWKKFHLVTWLMMAASCSYISFLWFFDGGISGSAIIVSLMMVILVSPIPDERRRRLFIFLILSVQGILHFTQYFFPDLVQAYQSLEDQFIGNYISFVFVAIISASLIKYILKNLRKEREDAQKARSQLKESEYMFRILAETTSTAIVLYQDQKFTYANPAAQKLYGYSLDELKMMQFKHLISPEDKEKFQVRDHNKGLEGKNIQGDEIRILTRSNKEIPVYIEASPIEYYGRQASLVSMIDLTRLREAETNLFNLQHYLSNIIDSMPSILVGVDANMNITQWNRQAENQTDLMIKDALDSPLFKVIPRLETEKDKIKKAVAEREILESIRFSYEKDGQICFEEITVYPLRKGGFEGAVILLDEVTEKVRLEEMVIQSEKMLSIGGLAAGMAHEINNPLAGILQNVQLAKNRLAQDIPANRNAAQKAGTSMESIRNFMEERRIFDQLDNINIAGGRAAKIVENMLSFAKKGTPKQSHDIALLLIKTIELANSDYNLKKKYDFKRIRIVNEFDPDVPEVHCEENKIMQVFFNIINNAAQAMYESDKLIENPTFFLRVLMEGSMVRIEIEDNGPGMGEDTRKRIFEPFFTTKDVNQGTGLGLSLSYFIVVKDHKGEMEVESGPEKGAKFIIRLPVR